MKATNKLRLAAISTVVVAALFAILIPQPWGVILSALTGIGGGLYMRSLFSKLK